MVKAVAFDYGRVISMEPAGEALEEMARLAGVSADVFERIRMTYRNDYDRGSMRGREYYQKVMREAGVPVTDEREFDTLADRIVLIDVHSWAAINGETEVLIRDVRKAGRKTGVLSNMPHDFLEIERDACRVFDICDVRIFSCQYNLIKPERKIYQLLISALDCAPEEIVFFDDIPVNVEGAQESGITAYLWKDAEIAQGILKSLDVLC
jgi:putative hydrolase of the HAD superfamily